MNVKHAVLEKPTHCCCRFSDTVENVMVIIMAFYWHIEMKKLQWV